MSEMLKVARVRKKLEDDFLGKVDSSDLEKDPNPIDHKLSRSIAALAIMMKCGIDSDEAISCITDGYQDNGIDAVYLDSIRGKLILVQSKWRNKGNGGITQEEMNSFIAGLKRILKQDFDGFNTKLQSKRIDIDTALLDMSYQICAVYIHTGNVACNDFVMRPMAELLCTVNEGGQTNDLMSFSEITISDIYDYLASGNARDDVNIDNVMIANWGLIESPYKAYYGVLSAEAIGEWFRQYGNKLFDKNIRYYKGQTDVNRGIREVLLSNPENFIYYNNGVKLLCRKITKKALHGVDSKIGIFNLEGVSLVNGAQTTGSIGAVEELDKSKVSKAKIFVQMIEIGNTNNDQAVLITRYTNTQNRIEGKDFAALDPEQERLKKGFKLLGIDYFYKSGARVEDDKHQISFDEALVGQACFIDDLSIVSMVKRNVGALTDNIKRDPYRKLFNSSTNEYTVLNNVRILREVDQTLAALSKNIPTQINKGVLVHGNRFLLHLVIRKILTVHPNYNNADIGSKETLSSVRKLCEEYSVKISAIVSAMHPIYLGHVFTNHKRLNEIVSRLNSSKSRIQSQTGATCRQLLLDL